MEESIPRGLESPPPSPGCSVTDTSHHPTATTLPQTHTHRHSHSLSHTHTHTAAPKPIPGAPHPLLVGVCAGLPGFSQGPAWRRWRHGHHGLFRSLSVLSFSGSFCPPPPSQPHGLHPAPAFPTPLGMKFGGFFCIFEVFCTLAPAPLCHPSPSVLTWKEIMHLCLL